MENKFWYDESSENLASAIFKYVDHLSTIQDYRTELNRRHLRLYGNYDVLGLADQSFTPLRPVDRLTLNVIAMNIDTATARIAKNRPRPRFLTSGGTEPMQRKGRRLEKFVDGILFQNKAHAKMQNAFRSACVFGDGFVKVFGDMKNGRIVIDKKFTPNILIDEQDGIYGDPMCIYECSIVNKYLLASKYPKKADAILSSQRATTGFYSDMYTDEQIVIIEAIKKASKNGVNDGKRVICTSNITLEEYEYSRARFPYAKVTYQPKEIGYFGEGISEMLTSIQYEINKSLRVAQIAVNLCVPKLMVEANSSVVSQHLNNEIGSILKYTGQAPVWSTIIGVPADIKEQIENLYNKSFQRTGLSGLSAFGEKPGGLSSGKALREYNDIETERFAVIAQGYENSYVDLWELCIDAAEELANHDKKYSVTTLSKDRVKRTRGLDTEMKNESYSSPPSPASMFSKTPAGRYDDIADMMDRGFLDKETATELLEFPDIEGYFAEANSPIKNIRTVVEMIVEKGQYYPPTPYQNLQLGLRVMNNMLLYYTDRGLEEERLELFARWISDATTLMQPPVPTEEEVIEDHQAMLEGQALEQEALEEQMGEEIAQDQALMGAANEAQAQEIINQGQI